MSQKAPYSLVSITFHEESAEFSLRTVLKTPKQVQLTCGLFKKVARLLIQPPTR
jgi:hypothetical protein